MANRSRVRLSWKEKNAILHECHRRDLRGEQYALQEICAWAQHNFNLFKPPCARTIRRIINQSADITWKNKSHERERKKIITLCNINVEGKLNEWINEMHMKNVFVTDYLIQEKARRLYLSNRVGTECRYYGSVFSNGWLQMFKKRISYKCRRTHGELGDSDADAAESERPLLQCLIRQNGAENVFNADEVAVYYRRIPRLTIGPAPVKGYKLSKDRITVLFCCNSNGTVRIPPLIIGCSQRPRCFGGKGVNKLGFDYKSSKKRG